MTPALCRGARNLLGWTIEELASMSGVGISTITSFEGVQRTPIRANLDALARALAEGGAIFLDANEDGRGVRLNKTAEALRDILLIAGFPGTDEYRMRRATQRIQGFYADALKYYSDFYGTGKNAEQDVRLRVKSDMQKLRDRVDWEIERRRRLGRDDAATRLLEPVTDYIHGQKWGA